MNRATWRYKAPFSVLALLLIIIAPAAANGSSPWSGEIPVIAGAKVIEEKHFQGSGSLELEADMPPAEVAEFYLKTLQEKGWPAGRIMTFGNKSAFMLTHKGDTFALRAEVKDGHTRVTLQMIRMASIEAAMKPQSDMETGKTDNRSVAQKDSVPLESNDRGTTLEGTPFSKGDLIRRPDFTVPQNAPHTGAKNDNLPEAPDSGDSPESEDASSEDAHSEDASQGHPRGPFPLPETIPVSIAASAEWHEIVRNEDGEEMTEFSGSYRMFINGTMTLDREGSPIISRQGIMTMPTESYLPDSLSASWIYHEEERDLKPEGKCKDPLIKRYHGTHGASITDGPRLVIANFSSSAAPFLEKLSEPERRFAAQLQSQLGKQMPDWYQFAVGGGTPDTEPREVTVKGVRAMGPPDCTFEDVEKYYPGFSIGLQMQLPPGETMTGYRVWQADCDGCFPPSFGLSVSDMAEFGGEKPLDPPEGGKKNVTYTLSWYLGVAPEVPDSAAADEDDEEDDCDKLQKRLNKIDLMVAAYKNTALQKTIKEFMGEDDLRTKNEFQKLVEYTVNEAINTNDGFYEQLKAVQNADGKDFLHEAQSVNPLAEADPPADVAGPPNPFDEDPVSQDGEPDPFKGSANMSTNAIPNFEKDGYGNITIVDYCSGRPMVVEMYNGDGNLVYNGGLDASLVCWQEKNGDGAGEGMWKGALEHERGHVRQFADKGPDGGSTKSVDHLVDRELKCYEIEKQEILKKMRDLGC